VIPGLASAAKRDIREAVGFSARAKSGHRDREGRAVAETEGGSRDARPALGRNAPERTAPPERPPRTRRSARRPERRPRIDRARAPPTRREARWSPTSTTSRRSSENGCR
jgi:hypothetical protein